MIVVLDTNVLLSAVFFPGVCDMVLAHCLLTPTVEVVLCEHILHEFVEHGTGKLNGSADRIEALVTELRRRCKIVEPAPIPAHVCDDPDDLPVLGAAIASNAQCLVTGDKDLLAMGSYQGVALLSPRVFYDRIRR